MLIGVFWMANDTVSLETELRNLRTSIVALSNTMSSGNNGSSGTTQTNNVITAGETEATRKAMARWRDQMRSSGNTAAIHMANNITTIGEASQIFSGSLEEGKESIRKLNADLAAGTITSAEFNAQMRALTGTTFEANTAVEDQIEVYTQGHTALNNSLAESQHAHDMANMSLKEFASEVIMGSKQMQIALLGFNEAFGVAEAAATRGSDITLEQAWIARKLGMSQVEVMNMTADYTQTIRAASMSTDDMANKMNDSGHKLVAITGSLKNGAKFALDSAELFKMSGGAIDSEMGSFTDNMASSFKGLRDSIGMTSEEFADLNRSLIGNAEVQSSMYKMTQKQQQIFMQEAQVRRQMLVDGGLRADQADAVIAGMESMVNKGAKERLKEAAKMQATLGAMGMGAQGQRAADIMRKGSRASAGEKTELQEILKAANFQAAENGQGSIQSEMVQDMLNGMNPMMGPDSPLAAAVTQLANALGDPPPSPEPKWFGAMVLKIGNIFDALKDDNLVKIIGLGVATVASTIIMKKVIGLFSGAAGGIASAASSVTTSLGSLGSAFSSVGSAIGSTASTVFSVAKVLLRFAGVVGLLTSAFTVGWAIGTKVNDLINEFMPNLGNAIGWALYNIVEFVKSIPERAMSAFNSFGEWIAGFLDNLIPDWMRDLAGGAAGLAEDAVGGAVEIGGKLLDGAGDKLKGFASTVDGWFADIGKIEPVVVVAPTPAPEIAAAVAAIAPTPEELKKAETARDETYAIIGAGYNNLSDKFKGMLSTMKENAKISQEAKEAQKTASKENINVLQDIAKQPMKSM